MAKINTYGYKMHGLKKASGATFDCGRAGYVQIAYHVTTGEIVARYHVDCNSWTAWGNYWAWVANTTKHMTMQEIADKTAIAIQDYNWRLRYYGDV